MTGRSSKPLFELMSARRASAAASTRVPPAPRVKGPKAPAPEPVAVKPPSPPAEPGARPCVTFPTTTLYVAIVVVFACCLLAYVVGYALGERAGKREWVEAGLGGASVGEPISDPVLDYPAAQKPAGGADRGTTRPGSLGPTPAGAPPHGGSEAPRIQPTVGSGPILTHGGRVASDPRTPDTNYLQMGDLPEGHATAAIEYFATKGERLIAIPLEDRVGASNDRWFRIYSLESPIPSGRFSEMGPERREHKRRVAEIGDRWRREERGGSDFSSAFYSLYRP